MTINEMLASTPVAPAPVVPQPAPRVRTGVTAEGIPYTVTVMGDAPDVTTRSISVVPLPPAQPVTIDPRQVRTCIDPSEEAVHYRELKLEVWGRLHRDLHEREALQRQLKSIMRIHAFGRLGHSMLVKMCRENAALLTQIRDLLTFLREGDDFHGSEAFFNWYYRDHNNFRNAFWEFWNLKHPGHQSLIQDTPYPEHMVVDTEREDPVNPPEDRSDIISVRVEPSITTPPAVDVETPPMPAVDQAAAPAADDGVPVRCEACGRFVSRISRCCSHCGRRY